jgi:hypothetical protein
MRIGSDPHHFIDRNLYPGLADPDPADLDRYQFHEHVSTFCHENFNRLSNILKIMTPLPLMRKEKQTGITDNKSLLSHFPTCVKLGVGSGCGSA